MKLNGSNALTGVTGSQGATGLGIVPYAQIIDLTAQTPSSTLPTIITMCNNVLLNGITHVVGS